MRYPRGPIERVENPTSLPTEDIAREIGAGRRVSVQFSGRPYPVALLDGLNALASRLGPDLLVRFYGHHGRSFDAKVLAHLPDIPALALDSLLDAKNLEAVAGLAHLRRFGLEGYRLTRTPILLALPAGSLEELSLGASKARNIDLAPSPPMSD